MRVVAILIATLAVVAPSAGAVESKVTPLTWGESASRLAYDSQTGSLYTATMAIGGATDYVIEFNPSTGAIVRRISLGGPVDSLGIAVSPNGRYAVVSEWDGAIAVVDLQTQTVTTIPASTTLADHGSATAFRPGTTSAYIPFKDVNDLSGHIDAMVVNPATASASRTMIGSSGDGRSQSDIAFNPSGATALLGFDNAQFGLVTLGSSTFTSFDPNGDSGAFYRVTIDPAGRYGYVASNADAIYRIDLATHATTTLALASGTQPQGIVVDRSGDFAYTANGLGASVTKIDLSSFSVAHTFLISDLGTSGPPLSIAAAPDCNRIAVGLVGTLVLFTPGASAPTALSATAGDGSATVSFTGSSLDNGSTITNYAYSIDGGAWTAATPATTSGPITVTGLRNDTTYAIRVRAINDQGGGEPSADVSITPRGAASAAGSTTTALTTSTPRVVGDAIVTSFRVSSAGVVTQTATRASAGRSRTVQLCSARLAVKRAGRVTIHCSLNARAKALRRRGPLTATLITRFTPSGGAMQS